MASHMRSASTVYHGTHEYSTFSASTIAKNIDNEELNPFKKYFCFICRLSKNLILHPVGPFRCIWDMFVMILLIYTSIEIPFTMSFGQSNTTLYISVCVDILLLVDIFLNFHTAYFDKYDSLRLVTNKKYICKKYFRTWFLIDFITSIPFELFIPTNDSLEDNRASRALTYIKILRVFRLLRIIKILRFLKMLRIFDAFMKQFVLREVIVFMKLFKIICGMLMFAHFAACLWWFVGFKTSPSWIDKKSIDDNIDLRTHAITLTRYSYAWYWAVVTLFTTGYGDVVATNTLEQWVCSISILIGTCFFAYFVGTLTVLITEGDKIKSYESDKLEEAQSFCEKKKLPKELTRAILTHIRYHCTYNYVFDESELLCILPSYLQHDIHTYVSKQFLLQLKIFQNEYIHLPEFIIGLIAVKIKSISCNQSYKLYDIGDIAKEFYIQRTGRSTMCDENGEVVYELSRGSVCGEYSSMLFKKRNLMVECDTWSEFYSICIDDIRQILDIYYPKSSLSKWKQIKRYLRESYKKNRLHSVNINNYNITNETSLLHHVTSLHSPSLHSPSLHSLPHSTTILKTKRSKTFLSAAQPSNYEESIHLFNNTKKKYTKHEQIPGFTRPNTLSRVHTPIPPDFSDNEDIEGADHNNIKSHKYNIIRKPPVPNDNYEYSLAKNQYVYHNYGVENDNKNDNNVDDKNKQIQKTENGKIPLQETKRKSIGPTPKIMHQLARFKIRSNSEVRDSVVVAHAVKHIRAATKTDGVSKNSTHRSSSPAMLLKAGRTKTMGSSQETLIPTFNPAGTTEMVLMRSNNRYHSKGIGDMICTLPKYEDNNDSENSFYSSYSSESSGSDNENGTKSNRRLVSIKSHKKAKIRKKKKAGKFGGRGARGGGGVRSPINVNHNANYKRHKPHKKKEKKVCEEFDDVPSKFLNQPSIDDSVLLAALDGKDTNNLNGARSESSRGHVGNINISIVANDETIVDDTTLDGSVTPLTFAPIIKNINNVETEPTIKEENTVHRLDMFGDEDIELIS